MKIIAEKTNGSEKWLLVDFGDGLYGYGAEADFADGGGLPVEQIGTKEIVMECCKLVSEMCKEYISKYEKLLVEGTGFKGWEVLTEYNRKKVEMLNEFVGVLEAVA